MASRPGVEEAFGEGVAAQEAPVTKPGQPLRVRAIAFLRASWAELQRVQWPDRRHVTQATTVVIGFLVVAGVYLGAADWVAQKIVNLILLAFPTPGAYTVRLASPVHLYKPSGS